MELFIAGTFFLLGAIIASFVGVVVARYKTGQGIVSGRSHCDACDAALSPLALIPLVSYVSSRGRAACCGARISPLSTIAEGVLGGLFALSYSTLGLTVALPFFLLALAALLALVEYDLMHQILPPSFLVVFSACAAISGFLSASTIGAFGLSALVGGGMALFFALLNLLSSGRLMGLADTPLVLGLALLVGAAASIPGFVFTFWIGSVIGIGVLLSRPPGSRIGVEVPLAPFLAAGFLLAFFTQWNPFFFSGLL